MFYLFILQLLTLFLTTFLIGLVPNEWKGKKGLHDSITRFSYHLLGASCSLIATYHQTENKPKGGGICVANHTSVIDIVPLGCETSFALVSLQWIIHMLSEIVTSYFNLHILCIFMFFFGICLRLVKAMMDFWDFCKASSVVPLITFGLRGQKQRIDWLWHEG